MQIRSSNRNSRNRGFTLVELLLTTLLILLLLAAVVLNFSPWQREAALREGADQFQTLLHSARAQAALTGRTVLVQFHSDTNAAAVAGQAKIQLLTEPDPLGNPGVFEVLRLPGRDLDGLNALVTVMRVTDLNRDQGRAVPAPVLDESALDPLSWAPLRFYPDGSSDSAEIELGPREADSGRGRVLVRLVGETGQISQRWLAVDEQRAGTEEPEGEETDAADVPALSAGASEQSGQATYDTVPETLVQPPR